MKNLKQLANQNIEKILKKISSCEYILTDSRIFGCCPVPHNSGTPNDNRTAFSWLLEPNVWTCFTHHCEEKYGSDIYGLIRATFQLNFQEAQNKLRVLLDLKGGEENLVVTKPIRLKSLYSKKKDKIHPTVSSSLVSQLVFPSYLKEDRKFSTETISFFHAGYCNKYNVIGSHRVVLPLYDTESRLVGFSCRATQIDQTPKWIHCRDYSKNWQSFKEDNQLVMSNLLFNIHNAKKHFDKNKSLLITEGPFDVMRLYEAGLQNVVALCGLNLTKGQKTILHNLGVKTLKLLLDNDKAGQSAAKKIKEKYEKYFHICLLEYGAKDPGDESLDKLRELVK